MQSSLASFTVANARPIDWYDGLVSGLVQLREEPRWYYVSLLAWSHEVQEQVLALVPVSDELAARMLSLLPDRPAEGGTEERSQDIKSEVSKLRATYRGKVRLIRCRHFGEPVVAMAELDVDEMMLREEIGRELEPALQEDQVEKWLGFPGLQPAS